MQAPRADVLGLLVHRPGDLAAARDLVDLVEKDDAVLLDVRERLGSQILVVYEARRFFVGDHLHGIPDLHFAQPLPRAAEILEHALYLLGQLLHAGRGEYLHVRLLGLDLDLDVPVVQLALAQLLAESLLRRRVFVAAGFRRKAGPARVERAADAGAR